MPTRDIAILFDGTYNFKGKVDKDKGNARLKSNVELTEEAMAFDDEETRAGKKLRPEVIYTEGIGTRYMEKMELEGAIAKKIPDRMKEAFNQLSDLVNDGSVKPEENRLFLFGFSRGAYTARLFAHMLEKCGIPKDIDKAEDLIDSFMAKDEDAGELLASGDAWKLGIKALCVWDTVKTSVIADYDDEGLPSIVEKAFHAMSIDENRGAFPVTKFNDKRAFQYWFAGVHSDVGGGYPSFESGLSSIALKWMLDRAEECGFSIKDGFREGLQCNPLMTQHNEMDDFWRGAGGEAHRDVLDGNRFHESVFTRFDGDPNYKAAYAWSKDEVKIFLTVAPGNLLA